MNTDIENIVKQCAACQDYWHIQLQEKTIPHEMLTKPKEIVCADIFSMDNETLFIIDYYSKFLVMRRAHGLSVDDPNRATKSCSQSLGYQKLVLDAGTSFMSDIFNQFCRQLRIDQ